MTTPITVFIADDDPVYLAAMREVFESASGVQLVGTATNGRDLVARAKTGRADVYLVDVSMPIVSGIDAVRAIRSRSPHSVVVMLTAFERRESLGQALASGAAGFLTKEMRGERIVEAVKQAHAGEVVMGPSAAHVLAESYRQASEQREEAEEFHRAVALMPDRLVEVLDLLIQGHGNREISDELGLVYGTVRNYASEILAVTGCRTRSQLAARALRAGYKGRR